MGAWHQKMLGACSDARLAFEWLTKAGFRLTEEYVSEGDNARYDGWHISYAKGFVRRIVIRIEYYEMELSIILRRGRLETNYFFLDHHLFGRGSGFQGNLFPPEKLTDVVARISSDMATNYQAILSGNRQSWDRISQLVAEEEVQVRREMGEYMRRSGHKFERLEAADAFRARDYARVVELLDPIADHLDSLELKKLDYAKKKT